MLARGIMPRVLSPAHLKLSASPGLVHTLIGTNVHDVPQAQALLHGKASNPSTV